MAFKIVTELRNIKTAYDTSIQILDGLTFRQSKVIRTIEFYSNDRYESGQLDELGREKPFYNILNGMCDVEDAAKDIDTKDINITSDDGQHYTESFLMTKDVYEWMKATNFAQTLNEMKKVHTKYGSLLAKKCLKQVNGKKQLHIEIPEWKNVLNDQIDILGGPIVEVHYMSPVEVMKKMEWDQEGVQQLMEKAAKNLQTRIAVYEVRGEFPRSFYKELKGEEISDADEYEFSYQLFYLAAEPSKSFREGSIHPREKLIPLYCEDYTEKCYKYLARKRKAGRGFGVGVFEEGEQAQVWTNDAVMQQKRAMEMTTKVIGQTATKKLKGRNMLNEVDHGTILEHDENKPISTLQLVPAGGMQQFPNLLQQWYQQLERVTSGYQAQRGETPPSGTPFRLQATILQQSSSVFTDLQEELGIFITELFNDWIMPHLAKQMNREHILAHEFSMEELKEIDRNFAIHEANKRTMEKVLSGEIVTTEQYSRYQEEAEEAIKRTKAQRFLNIPKDYYKKFKAKVTVNVTGEQRNKAAVLESLFNIMTIYAKNPALTQDPVLTQIFLRILEVSGSGISPVTIMGAMAQQAENMEKMAKIKAEAAVTGGQPTTEPEAPTEVPVQNPQLSLAASAGNIPS